jgi:hypothetical protein
VADEFGNAVVGLDPRDGSTVSVNTTGKAELPYWLAVGPDGNLWFTSDNTPARLGRIGPNLALSVISLQGLGSEEPLQLVFVNSSRAYLSTINLSSDTTTKACVCNGHIYYFDPGSASAVISPVRVGGDFQLLLPTSVSYSQGSLWVAQHGAAGVARFDLMAGKWTIFPTSLVGYVSTTLPLVIQASGDRVWFNEHYANKIGLLHPASGTLTEYSESNPPARDYDGVQNDLSIALADNGLWFTSLTGSYVGFVDGNVDPGFHVGVMGRSSATVSAGGNASFTIPVTGKWSESMRVNISDSENPQSAPKLIQISPSALVIQPGASTFDLGLRVAVGQTIRPGNYTLAVTTTNGNVQQTAYLFVLVK